MAKVLKEELFNFASLKGNNNKFYKIKLIEDNVGNYIVRADYGRLGALNPQNTTKNFPDLEKAEKEFNKKVKEKLKKGYVSVVTSDKDIDNVDSNVKKDPILGLISRLYRYSKEFVKSNVNMPLGNLSKKQVDKGRKILADIESLLDNGVSPISDEYINLSDMFYANIPFLFGRKANVNVLVINDYHILNQRKELLDVMESLVTSNLTSDIESQYKELGVELKHLNSGDVYNRLVKNIEDTKSDNHHFGFDIKNIFEVEYMKHPPVFNPYNVEVEELYHGSRSENIIHILQQGLKIKPKSAKHTGSMFGSGIYFADQSTKSANYCWGFGSKERDKNYYLLVCEVAVGKMKDFEDSQPHLTSAPWGYNSVRGVKGRSLMHNEVIVYKESQARIKYIVEFQPV